MPRATPSLRPAFTLADLAATIAASAGLLTVAAVTLGLGAQPDDNNARARNMQLKDATQVRGIGQAMILFASNNKDVYPLPSLLDMANMTTNEQGTAKDTSANIMSVLIFSGFIPVDMLVSPTEVSADISVFQTYEFVNPKAAAVGAQALWDPAFSVDFTNGKHGHLSYAHQIPAHERNARWSNTFNAAEPILGNRGPQVAAVRDTAAAERPAPVTAVLASKSSLTTKFYGASDSWRGNVAYNDNHVNFETSLSPGDVRYTARSMNPATPAFTTPARDVIFFDEPDAAGNDNAFLSIFTSAGPTTKYFRAIWD